ncbi:MAG: immunoglobulin domain-containing protein [Phycisphaerae bacterium]|nr:immunoglobulin domain-containing protein [Phycisphaerae bacterium]
MKKLLMLVMVLGLGLIGAYAEGEVFYEVWDTPAPGNDLTQVDWNAPPTEVGLLPNFVMWPRTTKIDYTFRYKAYLNIEQAGAYAFWVDSDDASWALINGVTVARWNGGHGMDAGDGRSGGSAIADGGTAPVYYTLDAGLHEMEVRYCQGTGGAGLEVRWEAPTLGIARDFIPDDVLSVSSTAINPPMGAKDVAETGTVLQWTNPFGVSHFILYFGKTAEPNELTDNFGKVTGTSASLDAIYGALSTMTTYYWRVDAILDTDANTVKGTTNWFETFSDVPVITRQPQNVNVRTGCASVFTIEATGDSPLTYQWYDAGTNQPIANAVDDMFATSVLGSYYCVVKSTATGQSVTSQAASNAVYTADILGSLTGIELGNPYTGPASSHTVQGNTVTITASGNDIWSGSDQCRFVYAPMIGDGEIIARVASIVADDWPVASPLDTANTAVQNWIKGGVMIRSGLDHNSAHVSVFGTSGNGVQLTNRRISGVTANHWGSNATGGQFTQPVWLRLTRQGNVFTGYYSADGVNWTKVPGGGTTTPITNPVIQPFPFPDLVYVGLALTAHDDTSDACKATVVFDNIQVRTWGAANPTPADGATNVAVPVTLAWEPAAYAPCDMTYQVLVDNDANLLDVTPVSVGTSLSYTPAGITTDMTIYWRVDSLYGGMVEVGGVQKFETVKMRPVILNQPVGGTVPAGDNAVLTVTAANANSVAWYKVGDAVIKGTGNTLTIAAVGPADTGDYYCVATNSHGDTQSEIVHLKVGMLVGRWTLDAIAFGDSNTVADSVGGRNGTVLGTPSLTTGVTGLPGDNAMVFNGVDDCVIVGPVGISGKMPRTITAWVKASLPIAGWSNIFGFTSTASGNDLSFDFQRRGTAGSEQYCLHVYGWETDLHQIDGEWHFLASTFDGTTIKSYCDGVYLGANSTRALNTADNVQMGRRGHYNDAALMTYNFFKGVVDDCRVYDYPLTGAQIAGLYKEVVTDATGLCTGPVAGDLNNDCTVNLLDFAIWAQEWGWCEILPISECD